MRNFMDYEGTRSPCRGSQAASDENGRERRWLDNPYMGDHVGRSVWALGEVLSTAWVSGVVGPARRLLGSLVATLEGKVSLHTAAYATLGLARLDSDRLGPRLELLLAGFIDQLEEAYRSKADDDWRWFEDDLRYDCARLPHALVLGGTRLDRHDAVALGLETLDWLGDECGLADRMLRLPGHEGRHRTEPAPGAGDEQPLDACAFVEAELAAFDLNGDPRHAARAHTAFDWFLGRNRLDRPLYDFATGGCGDGLGDTAVNENEGAESTLAFHRAHLTIDAADLPSRHQGPVTRSAAA